MNSILGSSTKKAKTLAQESSPASSKILDLSQVGIEKTIREVLKLTSEQLHCDEEEIFDFVKQFRQLRRQLEKDVDGVSEIHRHTVLASLLDCIVTNLGGISKMDQNKAQLVRQSVIEIDFTLFIVVCKVTGI